MAPGCVTGCVRDFRIRNFPLRWMRSEDGTGGYSNWDVISYTTRHRAPLFVNEGDFFLSKGESFLVKPTHNSQSNKGVLLLSPLFAPALSPPLWLSTVCSLWFLLHQEGWM